MRKCFTVNAAWRSACWCCVQLGAFLSLFFFFLFFHFPHTPPLMTAGAWWTLKYCDTWKQHYHFITNAQSQNNNYNKGNSSTSYKQQAQFFGALTRQWTAHRGCNSACACLLSCSRGAFWSLDYTPKNGFSQVSWLFLVPFLAFLGRVGGGAGVRELSVDDSSLIMWLFTPTQCLVCVTVCVRVRRGGILSNINQTIWDRPGV